MLYFSRFIYSQQRSFREISTFEYGTRALYRAVENKLPSNMATYPRRMETSATLLLGLKIAVRQLSKTQLLLLYKRLSLQWFETLQCGRS